MHLSLLLAQKIAGMFLMMFFGFMLVKMKLLKSGDSRILSMVCMYVVIPCMIIDAFQIECTPDRLKDFLAMTMAAVLAHVLFIILSRIIKKPLKLSRVEQLSLIYANSGNLIFPLVIAVFGEDMLFFACPYSCVFTILMWTHGRTLLVSDGKIEFRKIFLNVNVICSLLGMIFFLAGIRLPALIGDTLDSVGGIIGPISMLLTGMLIGGADLKRVFSQKKAYLVCLLRLIVYPLMMILVLKITGLYRFTSTPMVMMITLLAASAPSATTVTNLAQVYDSEPENAATINIIGMVGCIITIPVINLLYQLILL